MQPGMFPFAGLFPMQPGHWRRLIEQEDKNLPAAASAYFEFPQLVKSFPASLYMVMFEADLSTYTGTISVAVHSTADDGANWRTLVSAGTISAGYTLVAAGALITQSGAGIGVAGPAASAGTAWANTSGTAVASAGGPDVAGEISGIRAGVAASTSVTVTRRKLTIWALE